MFASTAALAAKYDYLGPKFRAGLQWLRTAQVAAMADGSYDIIPGGEVLAQVQRYVTVPADESRFEAHDHYFDIQYVVSGQETFAVARREGAIMTERLPERDLYFFLAPAFFTRLQLRAGDLVVVSPDELHQARVISGVAVPILKVVIKVRA